MTQMNTPMERSCLLCPGDKRVETTWRDLETLSVDDGPGSKDWHPVTAASLVGCYSGL
jgi:hypothetical protein